MKARVPFSRTAMNKAEQTLAAQIWQAIRGLQVFSLEEIATQLNLTTQDIQGYVFWLRRCGYVAFAPNGFELVKNTGSFAPVGLKTGFYDPNA